VSRTGFQWHELARTTNLGATALLLWDEAGRRVRVALIDERLGHYVDFDLRDEVQLSALQQAFGVARANGKTHGSQERETR
jgi:hypothetical protein